MIFGYCICDISSPVNDLRQLSHLILKRLNVFNIPINIIHFRIYNVKRDIHIKYSTSKSAWKLLSRQLLRTQLYWKSELRRDFSNKPFR